MKRLSIIIGLLLISAVLFASGQTEGGAEAGAAVSQAEQVEIYMKAMGNAPEGLPAVMEELNKRLLEDINATLRVEHYTWSDWKNKYRLDLVSGEPIDVIYTATWADFADYATDGAFKDIAPLLPEVSPQLWREMPQDRWAAATNPEGEIFAVPSLDFTPTIQGTVYREDLRKKYGLAPIRTLEDLESLMYAVEENEPQMNGLGNAVLMNWTNFRVPYHNRFSIRRFLFMDQRQPADPIQALPDFRDELVEWATIIRGYYDAGLFSHDVLANIASGRAAEPDFDAGLIPVNSRNHETYSVLKLELEAANPGWEIGFLPSHWSERGALPVFKGAFQDATAFPISGENTERGLQFVELAMTDPDYHTLLNYGVEGTNYVHVDSQSVRVPADTDYGLGALGMWGLRNSTLYFDRVDDRAGEILDELESEAQGVVVPDHPRNLIIYDLSPVQSTIAALEVIQDEMFVPFQVGLYPVEEIPERMDQYLSALEDAGIRDVQEYYQQFWLQYVDRL